MDKKQEEQADCFIASPESLDVILDVMGEEVL
jgi:hypothetical protein